MVEVVVVVVVLAIVLVVMVVAVAVAPSSGYKLPLLPVQTLKLTMTRTAHTVAAPTSFPTTLAEVLNAMSLTALPALRFQSLGAQHLPIWVWGPGLIASGVALRFLPVVLCKAKSTHKTAAWLKNAPEMLFSLPPQMLEKCVLRCMCLWPGPKVVCTTQRHSLLYLPQWKLCARQICHLGSKRQSLGMGHALQVLCYVAFKWIRREDGLSAVC